MATDAEKASDTFGLQIGQAIQYEWFRKDGSSCRYYGQWQDFRRLRLYARGEQPIGKYKNELAIDGDLSYLNLDWTPVPILPKFIDIVVNGMSMSRRDSAFANSGIVVAIEQDDLSAYQQYGALAGLEFQKDIEQKVFSIGDGSQKAPAQSIPHFISQKTSSRLPKTSYIPGIYSANIADILPKGISDRLQMGFEEIGKKMKGYIHQESIIVATESRTSSPVRIPRHNETKEHLHIQRLFPCGEGAGYAGGIISAAMDGQNTSEAIAILFGYLHA